MPGYGYPPPPRGYYGYPPVPARRTNGLAIAALVCGVCGFIYLVPAILGILFGCISLRQIRREGTDGRGMATARRPPLPVRRPVPKARRPGRPARNPRDPLLV